MPERKRFFCSDVFPKTVKSIFYRLIEICHLSYLLFSRVCSQIGSGDVVTSWKKIGLKDSQQYFKATGPKSSRTCLPTMEKHPNNLDDSDETEAQEESETEHVKLHVGPVDPHEGRLPDHLRGDE